MSFAELLAHDGVEEICTLRSPFGVMAFHGGNLEAATDTIAAEVAGRAGASLYAVCQPPDLRWHIPSVEVHPAASEGLARFLDHVHIVLTVHGYGREGYWTTLLLGGRNRDLADHLAASVQPQIGAHGYAVVDDLDAIPPGMRGLDRRNPVNLPRDAGVQLELPPRIRGTTPLSRPEHTEALVDGLVDGILGWDHEAAATKR